MNIMRQHLCLFLLLFPLAGQAETELDPTKYNESERLFLSAVAVELRPADSQVIYSDQPGVFRLLVESGANLKKGELWAVFDPEGLELERALLKADERSLPEEITKLAIARQEEATQLKEAMKLTESNYQRLALSLQETEVKEDEVLAERVRTALADLEKQLALSRQKLELSEKGGIFEGNVERLKINLQRKKTAFENLVKKAEHRASFDGVLQLLGPLSEGKGVGLPRTVFVEDIEAVALLKSVNLFEIELEPMVLDFNGVTRSRLFIEIDSEKGEGAIRANFNRLIVNQKDPSRVEGWLFEVLEQDSEDVKNRSMGNRAFASVFLDLGEPAVVIPKADFLKHLPESGEAYRGDWKRLVATILPEYEFVAEARRALAVRLKEKAEK